MLWQFPGLNRPGGTVTGTAFLSNELAPKRLQLLHDLIPNAARFGVLVDPAIASTQHVVADLQAAARMLGIQLVIASARTDGDLETAFAGFSQQRVGAVLVGTGGGTLLFNRMVQIAALAAGYALPAIYPWREFALAGGLMSYGSSLEYPYHQAGIYAGRILKGEEPGDLPVVQQFELVINLKTASALGLTIPETMLATADEVIQ
jgi:putative tryptophan/tyrosine transport system substrate-binding protein